MSTWYGAVEAGLQDLRADPLIVPELDGAGLRLQSGAIESAGPLRVGQTPEIEVASAARMGQRTGETRTPGYARDQSLGPWRRRSLGGRGAAQSS
jgi:hypothetical protein